MLTFKHWELISTGVVIILSIIFNSWRINRARKKDFNLAMTKKADKDYLDEKIYYQKELLKEKLTNQNLKILMQETRLNKHEEQNNLDREYRMNEMTNMNKAINHVSKRVDEILQILSSKRI